MNLACFPARLRPCALLIVSLLPTGLAAQSVPPSGDPHTGRPKKTVTAVLSEGPIRLDGVLDEPVWKTAVPASDFVQREPKQGQPATERTEARVAYDKDAIYFGMTAYDSEPDRMVINNLEQDFPHNNQDGLSIYIDTFDDDRNSYVYYFNAVGARKEMQSFDEGRDQSVEWEDVWDVRTQRTSEGWTAEVRIPFKSLRFKHSETQRWGINFGRRIR